MNTFPKLKGTRRTRSYDKSIRDDDSFDNLDDSSKTDERKTKSASSLNLSEQDQSVTLEHDNTYTQGDAIIKNKKSFYTWKCKKCK